MFAQRLSSSVDPCAAYRPALVANRVPGVGDGEGKAIRSRRLAVPFVGAHPWSLNPIEGNLRAWTRRRETMCISLDPRFTALALALLIGAVPTGAAANIEIACHFDTICKAKACEDTFDHARDVCNKGCPGANLDSVKEVPTCRTPDQKATPVKSNLGNVLKGNSHSQEPAINPARQDSRAGKGVKH